MQSTFRAFALSFVGIFVSTTVASAVIVEFNFDLTPEQVVDPVVSDGFGTGFVTLDTETNELTWDVDYQDLAGTLTAAHFHGPADFGENFGVFQDMDPDTGATSGSIFGSATITGEEAGWITDGLAYINLHTTEYPGGEIRGQVIPEPGTYALMFGIAALGGAIFWRRRRTRKA